MKDVKEECRSIVTEALNKIAAEKNIDIAGATDKIAVETPPNPEMGDIGMPMFPFAKMFRGAPMQIAKEKEVLRAVIKWF